MTAVMPQRPTLQEPVVLTAQQYDALPPNNRMELVDGVVTLMTPATMRHQIVVQKLRAALEADRPDELKIVWEQEVRLADLLRRNPDVMAVLASAYNLDGYSYTPSQVVLAAEVVSPHTQVTDRLHKPAEYATAGIEHYWRGGTRPPGAPPTHPPSPSGRHTRGGAL